MTTSTRQNGILFVHQNFPGQFPHIARALVERGEACAIIGSKTAREIPGVEIERWSTTRGTTKGILDIATRAEADLIRAQAAAKAALKLKAKGFTPRLIIGHPGWGETLLLKEVWPEARQIVFSEFFYRPHGADVGFDPEAPSVDHDEAFRIMSKNMGAALALSEADRIVSPTPFQASLLPQGFRERATVLHEGVDLGRASRQPNPMIRVSKDLVLDGSKPVITFVNRALEPLRGFRTFMRAMPRFLAEVPDAHVLIIGSSTHKPYGQSPPAGRTWKDVMMAEVKGGLDMDRVHFTGSVEHSGLMAALSMSWAHVYYTYPFVLSWSLTEAMACECLILGSDTAPVRDAIEHGVNGLLTDFFDVDGLTDRMIEACRHPERFAELRKAARRTALEKYDRETVGVPGWLKLIDETAPV